MKTLTALGFGLAAMGFTLLSLESDARACGGCFAPPDTPTVVTDHRMILSVSKDQTSLYDQFRYQGDPSAFAWVLPIVGTVQVGLSSDQLFNSLDQTTQTTVQAPPRNCPAQPNNCRGAAAPSAAGGDSAQDTGVSVLAREVVGPYETVQLRSTDPDALGKWLADNKFSVPDDIKPVIAQYVAEKFDFLALKLIPGKGVNDMKPVRVTTPGAAAVLPLRMVAAGTGAVVGVTLWVVAEGRYQPQNFPSYRIEDSELAWDWTQNRSNYSDLRKSKTDAGGGKIWELESSIALSNSNLYLPEYQDSRGDYAGYSPIKNDQGVVTKTAQEVYQEDMAALFKGIPAGSSRVTRIRADLARTALASDLLLTASSDQALLPNSRIATKELSPPQCPVFSGCEQVGTAPRDEAAAQTDVNNNAVAGGKTLCTVSSTARKDLGAPMTLVAMAGFLGLAWTRSRRKQR
jgi:hypothetical protein